MRNAGIVKIRPLLVAIATSIALGTASAQAAPAKTPTRARQTQNTYIYLSPSLNRLSVVQTGAIPLSYAATTISALSLRGGYVFGAWAVEGNALFANYTVRSLVDERGERQSYTSRRIGADLMRRLFANQGKLRLSGHARLGLQAQTLPLVYAVGGFPLLGRLSSTNLSVGFALSSYLSGRTRISLTAKWLPALGLSGNVEGASDLKAGFGYELNLGAQHLLDNNWSVGLFANLQGASVSGTLPNLDEERLPMEVTHTESALQLVAGYQF
jgi:hypothetical protein